MAGRNLVNDADAVLLLRLSCGRQDGLPGGDGKALDYGRAMEAYLTTNTTIALLEGSTSGIFYDMEQLSPPCWRK